MSMMNRLALLAIAGMLSVSTGCLLNTYSSDDPKRVVESVASPGGTAPPSPSPAPTLPVGTNSVLTVANVYKEEVKLFTLRENELRFVQKLAAGEAVDLSTPPGTKWAAVFSAEPHCANYAVKGIGGEIWLLRPNGTADSRSTSIFGPSNR